MRPSRRAFVEWMTASGISLSLSSLGIAEDITFDRRETLPGRNAFNPAARGAGRVDGVAKVTGAKLYASDFRAADMPEWPTTTSHAILIRAPDATHIYLGMDLARLSGAMKPTVIVTAAEIDSIGLSVPAPMSAPTRRRKPPRRSSSSAGGPRHCGCGRSRQPILAPRTRQRRAPHVTCAMQHVDLAVPNLKQLRFGHGQRRATVHGALLSPDIRPSGDASTAD